MITAIVIVAVLVVLLIAAVAATHGGDMLADAPADFANLGLPTVMVQPEDIAEVRFGMALRGYRMEEVDHVLERLSSELASRDAQIAKLQDALADVIEPALVEVEQAQPAPSWVKPAPQNPAPSVVSVVAWSPTVPPTPVSVPPVTVEPVAPEEVGTEPAALEELGPEDDSLVAELAEQASPDAVAEVLDQPTPTVPDLPAEPAAETPAEPAALEAPAEESAPAEPEPEPQPVSLEAPAPGPFGDDDFPDVLAPEDAPHELPEAQEPQRVAGTSAPPAEPRAWSTPASLYPTSPPVQAPPGGEDEPDA